MRVAVALRVHERERESASVAAASGLKKCVAPRREKVHRVQAEGLIRELPLRVVVPSRLACFYFV